MSPSIQVKGLATVQGLVAGLPREWDEERERGLKLSGKQMVKFWRIHLAGPGGPRKLSVQTGRLLNSISVDRRRSTKDVVIVGSDAPYAAAHEFGVNKIVSVQAHIRRAHRVGIRSGSGVAQASRLAGPVRAHPRRMRLPERPHRKPAVEDMIPIHRKIMAGAVDEAIREAKKKAKSRKAGGRAELAGIVAAGGTGRR